MKKTFTPAEDHSFRKGMSGLLRNERVSSEKKNVREHEKDRRKKVYIFVVQFHLVGII
jgi:hypothetical protein